MVQSRNDFPILKNRLLFLFVLLFLFACTKHRLANKYNFDFEQKDTFGTPLGWVYVLGRFPTDKFELDSLTKFDGHYSLSLNPSSHGAQLARCFYTLPATFSGREIKLTAFIKSDSLVGKAGLYLSLQGSSHEMVIKADPIDTLIQAGTDWKQYAIQLPFDASKTSYITVGAYLEGRGEIWVDHFQVLIDGVPIEKLQSKHVYPAQKDTLFNSGTNLSLEGIDSLQIDNLKTMGIVWGFLKYHHPEIKKGNVNWDAVLFKTLPQYLAVHNIGERNVVLETMAFSLDAGNIPSVENDVGYDAGDREFEGLSLSSKLLGYLKMIKQKSSTGYSASYYVDFFNKAGNPTFQHEVEYNNNGNPDVGIRILALYRFWNMIEYFYVNKNIIGREWNEILVEFLPKFIKAKDRESYALTCVELIASIHDTHAGVYGNTILEKVKGSYIAPFQAKFIENKLVVTGYYTDDAHVKKVFLVGDIIETINGIAVDSLVKRYAPYTPASNFSTMLRDLSSAYGFLLRSSGKKMTVKIFDGLERKSLSVATVPIARIDPGIDYMGIAKSSGFSFIGKTRLLCIYPSLLKEHDLDSIKLLSDKASGIIIDLRCYPAIPMPYIYGAWLKPSITPFVTFSKIDSLRPGHIIMADTLCNGSDTSRNFKARRVAILVNEQTQSQAEFTVMALQTAPLAKVIGSATAGADGNISAISLPGGIDTYISGIGIFYPDGFNTQRAGVKIDINVSPTVKGIRTGKDEILERGIKYIEHGR